MRDRTEGYFDATLGVFVHPDTPIEAFDTLHPTKSLGQLMAEPVPADGPTETRLERFARLRRQHTASAEASQIEADARGELWTVQAAMKPGSVFCLIYHGKHEDTEPLASQHRAAPVIFGPVYLIGDHKSVVAEALALFTVDEITLRTIR